MTQPPLPPLHANPDRKLTLRHKLLAESKTLLVYGAIFVVIYTALSWWRQPVMPAHPNLVLTDLAGNRLDLAVISQDRPTLVYFWGSWCHACAFTSPKVNQLAQNSAYPVISIAVHSGTNAELAYYLYQKNLTFTTINDEEGKIFADWQGQVTPSYVILKEGKMVQGLTGVQPEWSLRLRLWLSTF